jgi:hypothetical protein
MPPATVAITHIIILLSMRLTTHTYGDKRKHDQGRGGNTGHRQRDFSRGWGNYFGFFGRFLHTLHYTSCL